MCRIWLVLNTGFNSLRCFLWWSPAFVMRRQCWSALQYLTYPRSLAAPLPTCCGTSWAKIREWYHPKRWYHTRGRILSPHKHIDPWWWYCSKPPDQTRTDSCSGLIILLSVINRGLWLLTYPKQAIIFHNHTIFMTHLILKVPAMPIEYLSKMT